MEVKQDNVFIKRLEASKQELQTCQENHQVASCSQCDKFIGCELRKEYVKHVYESMSQGQTGGFEF